MFLKFKAYVKKKILFLGLFFSFRVTIVISCDYIIGTPIPAGATAFPAGLVQLQGGQFQAVTQSQTAPTTPTVYRLVCNSYALEFIVIFLTVMTEELLIERLNSVRQS